MAQKAFVLVQKSVCDAGQDTHVWTFTSKEKAIETLNDIFSADKNEIAEDVRVCDKGEDYYEVYEEGRYNENNLTAHIYETELNPCAKTSFWDRYYSLKQEVTKYIQDYISENGEITFEHDSLAVDITDKNGDTYSVAIDCINDNCCAECEYGEMGLTDISVADLCYIADELTPKSK